MRTPRPYLATIISAVLAILVLAVTWLTHVDLLDELVEVLESLEAGPLDEGLLAGGLLLLGMAIDLARRGAHARRQVEIQAHRLRVFRATMQRVHEIVGRCLQGLQLIRVDAEDALPATALTRFDALVHDVAAQLRGLSELSVTPEGEMAAKLGIDYPRPPGRG